MKPTTTRRRFLSQANCAAITSLPILNTILNLKLAGSVAAASSPADSDYRALVCLYFSGGMDTFNVLVPRGAEYAEYAATRKDIAVPQSDLLPLTAIDSPLQLGLHPGMAKLADLFESGDAAYIANVGTLIEPVTKAQYNAGTGRFPLGLYSHSDQTEQWHTSTPDIRSSRGWGGKAADVLNHLNNNNLVSMNISLSGGNVWQSGQSIYSYAIGTGIDKVGKDDDSNNAAEQLTNYDPSASQPGDPSRIYTKAVDSQLALDYQHLLSKAFTSKKRDALDTYQLFNSATTAPLPASVTWPAGNYIGRKLRVVAKSIAGRMALGHKRQTFFVEVGGWDHHSDLKDGLALQLPEVDLAVKAFYDTLGYMLNDAGGVGMQDQVTLFTASDFARTLTSNNKGSDHAWGSNHFVVGGAVNGRKVYGTYPSLIPDGSGTIDDRGTLIPTTSVDQYFSELATWFGVPAGSMSLVLPNRGNFSSTPLGFLA